MVRWLASWTEGWLDRCTTGWLNRSMTSWVNASELGDRLDQWRDQKMQE